jgi:hypothetical protein
MEDYKLRDLRASHTLGHTLGHISPLCQVYLQQNKKKAEAEGKNCHAKTMELNAGFASVWIILPSDPRS